MEAVGVRRLSLAVEKKLVTHGRELHSNRDIMDRLRARHPLIRRVVDEEPIEVRQKWDSGLLDTLNIKEVTDLEVCYRIKFNQTYQTQPEPERVFWDTENRVLYYKSQDDRIPWAAHLQGTSLCSKPRCSGWSDRFCFDRHSFIGDN